MFLSVIEIGLRTICGEELHPKYRVRVFREDFCGNDRIGYYNRIPIVFIQKSEEDLGIVTEFCIYRDDSLLGSADLTHSKRIIKGDILGKFDVHDMQIDAKCFSLMFGSGG